MPRFAANLAYMFTERPLIERFGAAPAARRAERERHGLGQLGINTQPRPNGGESGLGAVPGREREFAEVFKQALDYAVAIGGSAIHTMAGMVPPEQRPAAERVFVANYSRAADLAAQKDIMLLIEPLNARDRPDYFVSRVEQAADLIAKVDRPNVRIQFDFYHIQIIGGDLLRRFEKFLTLTGHVQVAAVPSRAEPDEGEVNYPAVFDALDRLGPTGGGGCGDKPRGRTEDGWGWGRRFGLGR